MNICYIIYLIVEVINMNISAKISLTIKRANEYNYVCNHDITISIYDFTKNSKDDLLKELKVFLVNGNVYDFGSYIN